MRLAIALLCAALCSLPGLLSAQPMVIVAGGNELTPIDEIPPAMAERGVIRLASLVVPPELFVYPLAGPVVMPIDIEREVSLVEKSRRYINGKTYVIGVVSEAPNSRFVMMLEDGALRHGEIRAYGEVNNLTAPEPVDDGIELTLVTIDPSLQPEAREPAERVQPGPGQGQGTAIPVPLEGVDASEDAGVDHVVRIMVVYTPAARQAFDIWEVNPTRTIDDEIEWAVFLANLGYEDQGNFILELVHTREVNYAETGNIAEDLERLACPCDHMKDGIGDNHLNEVFTPWRNYEADLVSLWVDYWNDPGYANIINPVSINFAPLAVSVVDWGAAVPGFSFEHEIGHNFGARHDRLGDPTDGEPYVYNHGYVNAPASEVTVMAYRSSCKPIPPLTKCERVQVWSDPDHVPAGDWGVASGSNSADNARVLRTSAETMSKLFEEGEELIGCCINHGGWFNLKWGPGKCPW